MTTKQIQKIEKIANESLRYASKAIKKSEELQSVLSLMEYQMGKKKEYSSVDAIFKKRWKFLQLPDLKSV